MKTNRRVRFIAPWRHYKVGQVIEPPGTLWEWLLRRGFVESVLPEGVVTETAMTQPPESAALRTNGAPVKRKRGRPRKVRE